MVVNSFTEWDPLEEVLVGVIEGGVFPSWQDSMYATMPPASWQLFKDRGGSPFPTDQVSSAQRELDRFAEVLGRAGITVVRPDASNAKAAFGTPEWSVSGGLYAAMPRDLLLVVGDAIVEAPMSWRCRHHEIDSYRRLIKDYFRRGARWLPAPTPQLAEDLFDPTFADPQHDAAAGYAITEFEPVFDAADFVRFGRDILAQRSHVTNSMGIDWLRRAVGPEFRVTEVAVNDPHAMHIDASVVPLAPGKLLVNGDRYIPHDLFKDWEVRFAPPPALPPDWPLYFTSSWLSMNVLSLDSHTVVVERDEQPMIDFLTEWGFDCVPVDFRHVYTFGGSFHCTTLDVRRSGSIESYL